MRERERSRLVQLNKKWNRREENEFLRVLTGYGIDLQSHTPIPTPDWSRFKAMSRLEKKTDETLSDYYKVFIAMCKRQAGVKLLEDEKGLENIIDDINEDHARLILDRLELLSKLREVAKNPKLDERLKLCKNNYDTPDWWEPGRHDKELIRAILKHGLYRTDALVMNDSELSFRDACKKYEKNLEIYNQNTIMKMEAELLKLEQTQLLMKMEKEMKAEEMSMKLAAAEALKQQYVKEAEEEEQKQVELEVDLSVSKSQESEIPLTEEVKEVAESLEVKETEDKKDTSIKEAEELEKNQVETEKMETSTEIESEGKEMKELREDSEQKVFEKPEESQEDVPKELTDVVKEPEIVTEEKETIEKLDTSKAEEKMKIAEEEQAIPQPPVIVEEKEVDLKTTEAEKEKPTEIEEKEPKEVSDIEKESIEKISYKKTEEDEPTLTLKEVETDPKECLERDKSPEKEPQMLSSPVEKAAAKPVEKIPDVVLPKMDLLAELKIVEEECKKQAAELKARFPDLEVIQPAMKSKPLDALMLKELAGTKDLKPFIPKLLEKQLLIRWYRDFALEKRISHIIYCVEKNDWPVGKSYSAYTGCQGMDLDVPLFETIKRIPTATVEINLAGSSSLSNLGRSQTPDVITITTDQGLTKQLGNSILASIQGALSAGSGNNSQQQMNMAGAMSGAGKAKRKRHIAIDVETERAKLHALLNNSQSNREFNICVA